MNEITIKGKIGDTIGDTLELVYMNSNDEPMDTVVVCDFNGFQLRSDKTISENLNGYFGNRVAMKGPKKDKYWDAIVSIACALIQAPPVNMTFDRIAKLSAEYAERLEGEYNKKGYRNA